MKKIISIAIVSLMAFSMAFGASAMVNADGTTPSAASGMMTIMTATAQASETKDVSSGTGAGTDANVGTATVSGTVAPDQAATTLIATASGDTAAEGAVVSTDVEDLKRTVEATDDTAVATNEETGTDELMYTTGIGAAEEDHTLLYALSIVGAVLLVGIPVSMKLLKKAD